MDSSNQQQQPVASSSSASPLPAGISTHRAAAAPSLPTPDVDGQSFLESVLSRTSFSDDFAPVITHEKEVRKLEKEKELLDRQLKDLQTRLKDAEVKMEKRRSAGLVLQQAASNANVGGGGDRAVSAGGSR